MLIGSSSLSENPLSFPNNDAVDPDNRLTPEVTPEYAIFSDVVYVEATTLDMTVLYEDIYEHVITNMNTVVVVAGGI